MASNSRILAVLSLSATLLAGCSVSGPRESPLKEVTEGSPTVLDVYRGKAAGGRLSGPWPRLGTGWSRTRPRARSLPTMAGPSAIGRPSSPCSSASPAWRTPIW